MIACRRALLFLLAVLLVLPLTSCGRTAPRYFAYLDAPAVAALSGKLGDVAFTARLESGGRAAAAGGTLSTGCDFTLTYLSPAALAGVRVDYTVATGEVAVSLGNLCARGDVYAALAAPGLLFLTESPVQSTTRQADGALVLTTADGARRMLTADGVPLSLAQVADGRRVEFAVERFVGR